MKISNSKMPLLLFLILCFCKVQAQEEIDSVTRNIERRHPEEAKRRKVHELQEKKRDIYEFQTYFSLPMSERCNYYLGAKDSFNEVSSTLFYQDLMSISNQKASRNIIRREEFLGIRIHDTGAYLQQIINYYDFLYHPVQYSENSIRSLKLTLKHIDFFSISIFSDYTLLNPIQRIAFLDTIINDTVYTDYFGVMKTDLDRLFGVTTYDFMKNRKVDMAVFNRCVEAWRKRSHEDYLNKGIKN